MLCCWSCCLVCFRACRAFRPPSEGESLFSCVAKRKVTKREGHPAWRFLGILRRKCVRWGRAFRQHIRVLAKRNRHRADSPFGACRPHLTAAQGPGRAGARPARTFQKSKKPDQKQSRAQAKAEAKASRPMPPLHPIRHRLHHHRAEMHQLRQWKRQFDAAALLRCLRVADLVGLHLRQHGA